MKTRICIFGDSITRGGIDPEFGGWVGRLRKEVEPNSKEKVYNLGISGDTTEDLLKRFDVEAEARQPAIILIAIGVNDSSFRESLNKNKVPFEQFRKNIEILFLKANKFTKKIIFVGITKVDETKTTPIPWDIDAFYKNENIEQYNQAIKDLCKNNNLLFIEMSDVLDKEDLSDGLHPNAEGHEKIFQRVKDSLIKNKYIN